MDVARREREAVRLAHGRAGDHLGRDGQVARHLADDHDLLGVLLAEVGVLGADQVEQDRDDRRDAVEMARPGGALERLGDGPDRDDRVEAGRVDLRRVGREDDVDALRLADGEVARLVARVLRVVVGDVELARVDEDRHDRRRVGRPGPPHQRAVALVQPAHRRARGRPGVGHRPGHREARRGFGRSGSSASASGQRSRSSGMPPDRDRAAGRSDAPRPSTSSRTASSIRTVCSGPGTCRRRRRRRVGGGRVADLLADVGVRPGVLRDEVAQADEVGDDLDLAAAAGARPRSRWSGCAAAR